MTITLNDFARAGWLMPMLLLTANVAQAVEPPVLTVTRPVSGEKYASTATIAIEAKLMPALFAAPEVRMFQVLDDGLLFPQGGVTGRFDDDSRFAIDVGPGVGWRTGVLRIVIQAEDFPKQRQVVEVEIVPTDHQAGASDEPIRTDVIVDLDSDDVPTVSAGQIIAVKGTFEWIEDAHGPAPAALIVQIRQPDADSKGDVIRNDATAACRQQDDGNLEYYAEIQTPSEAGDYLLRAYLPYRTSLGERKTKPIQQTLTVQATE